MTTGLSTYALCRLSVAFVWFYHGLFPKLLGPHRDELAMNMALGLDVMQAGRLSMAAGVAEIAFAILMLVLWQRRWPLQATIAAMIGLLGYVAAVAPALLAGAFNPVTTNLCVLMLSLVALRELPRRGTTAGTTAPAPDPPGPSG